MKNQKVEIDGEMHTLVEEGETFVDIESEPKIINIEYTMMADRSLNIYGIPVGNETVNIKLRPITRRDRVVVQGIDQNDPDSVERLVSLLIVKWGDRDGITSLELMDERYDDAVLILSQAINKFFQKEYRFVPRQR